MSEYIRSIALYIAMFVMVFTIAGFSTYYSNVSSMKQDTYKEFMYTSMNKSKLRLEGAEDLFGGDFNAYYLDSDGSYSQLDYEIVKQLGLSSKVSGKLDYEMIYNYATNEYFLHITSTDVDSVLKFTLEEGENNG